MDNTIIAYLAGAMDSDGYFSIKKSTYHMRVRHDANNPIYSERIGLKQITPYIPKLLAETFGGGIRQEKGCSHNSHPLWVFQTTNLKAAKACKALLPYAKVKKQQIECLLELRKTHEPKFRTISYWFQNKYPDWRNMELITSSQAACILNYTSIKMVSQAISNGLLIALPYEHTGKELPRIPKQLVLSIAEHAKESLDGKPRNHPNELIAWRQELWEKVRELNKIGINGTPVYHREGSFALADLYRSGKCHQASVP